MSIAQRSQFLFLGAFFLSGVAHADSKADQLAGLYGETLGEASGCASIAGDRIAAVAALAKRHLREVAGSVAAADSAAKELDAGVVRGKRDVSSGMVTCTQAASELADLEHDLR
jgi:hypothetical protein